MLVARINEFITALEYSTLACDVVLHKKCLERFSMRDAREVLTKEDYQFIKEQFKTRWFSVRDTDSDYTFNPSAFNRLWVDLAKELAQESVALSNRAKATASEVEGLTKGAKETELSAKKCREMSQSAKDDAELAKVIGETYVKILFPDVINTVDYHDLSLLTETENPENFYLGAGSRILYRKRSLYDHLLRNNYVLSSVQNESNKSLRPLRIEELTRLKLSKHSTRKISIGEGSTREEFISFWELLKAKAFPKLNPSNLVPIDILPYFLQLIEAYFKLKESKAPFAQFKSKLNEFLKFLYAHDVDYVNQFYGITIEIAEQKRTMLDFLIDVHQADSYSIDSDLSILAQWLAEVNPLFRLSNCTSLASTYSSNTQVAAPIESLDDRALHECKLMLLSLFTQDLRGYSFSTPIAISVWDKESKVPAQIADIYERFIPLLKTEGATEAKEALIARFREIKKKKIDTHVRSSGLLGFFSCAFTGPMDTWYEHVKEGTLSSLNVYWYDSELIMHTLMHFQATNSDTQGLIWSVLDDLIHTYSQDMPTLQKQLRVNILFSKFMEKIEGTAEHNALRLLLKVYAENDSYQSDFMINCTYYIGNKLRQLDFVKKDAVFYTPPATMKELKAKIARLKINSVGDLIRTYKEEITHHEEIKKDPARCRRLTKTLVDLSKPILTCEEQLEAEHNVPGRDPLGAPT